MDLHHKPVLLEEVLNLTNPRAGDVVCDCTAGLGGHSAAMAARVGPTGLVIGFDLDAANLARASEAARSAGGPFAGVHDNFVLAPQHLQKRGMQADIVLADLGFSSNQMDDPQRGFSFGADGPLDMRLDSSGTHASVTAADFIAASSERELADLIYEYGEEPLARKIARKLVQNRQEEPIRSTAQLARLVTEAYGQRARSSRMHPATRTFMALRIAVNDELGALRGLLDNVTRGAEEVSSGGWLKRGTRVAIISFHSLEDRLVKQCFAELAKRGLAERITRKPVTASEEEIRENPRARSAKLRVVRIGDPDNG
jgi:16S rRNA (cytosine1402-N4)-methyltransferase